jgi:putative DNA primase/helicase
MTTDLGYLLEQQILPRLTAAQIYTHSTHEWQKAGDKWRGGCPWHDSKSGTSFYIDVPTLLWRCPACDIGGGPVQYLHRLRNGAGASPRGQDFIDIVSALAKLAGVDMPQRELTEAERQQAQLREARRAILQAVMVEATALLWSDAGAAARAYLATRGFNDAAVQDLGLGLYGTGRDMRAAMHRGGHSLDEAQAAGVFNPELQGYVLFPWNDDNGRPLTSTANGRSARCLRAWSRSGRCGIRRTRTAGSMNRPSACRCTSTGRAGLIRWTWCSSRG